MAAAPGGLDMSASWPQRRVLVTGATGIVGSWLCNELLERGASVVAFVRDDDPQSHFYTSGAAKAGSIVRGDLARYEDCTRAINSYEIEIVFHLGAQTLVGTALRDPLDTFESNIRGTYNMLEAARHFPTLVKAVVVASSDKAYGDALGRPYVEDMPLRANHPYDVSKSCADLLATTYAHTYGVPIGIARCGNIYGGGDLNWSRIVPGTIRSLLRGARPELRSDGSLVRDYIYVRDVVAAYMLVAESIAAGATPGEAYNFSCESRVTVLEMVDRLATLCGVRLEPSIASDTVRFEIREQTLSAAKARAALGWEPAWPLDDGLIETIAWYRNHLGYVRLPPILDAVR